LLASIVNMQPTGEAPMGYAAAPPGAGGYGYSAPGNPSPYQPPTGAYGAPAGGNLFAGGRPTGPEVEMMYAGKHFMGRLIGSKGITINDLQKRSGCDIQINQNVPPGQDCEITLRGTRQSIELAKSMIGEIQTLGPNHPYAGGNGGQPSDPYAGAGYTGYDQSQGYGGYQQQPPQPVQPQYGGYGGYGQQPNQPAPGLMSAPYGQPQPAMPYGQPVPGAMSSQPPSQAFGGYGSQPYGGGGGAGMYGQQLAPPPPPVAPPVSDWNSATTPEGQTYYYNTRTNVTQWTKPAGMP
jgi:KH domain/WW domain